MRSLKTMFMTVAIKLHTEVLSPAYYIEQAHPCDYETIACIYNEYILQGDVTMEEELFDAQRVEKWVNGFNDREKLFVLKNLENHVIGWGAIKRYSDRAGYRTTCETSVYLKKSEIAKGLGTFLKKSLLAECKQLGYHHVVARVLASNTASYRYNKKLGFEVAGIQKEVGMKNGKWEDLILMQYIIR